MSTAPLIHLITSAADNPGEMVDTSRKAKITDEHRAESARLKALWDAERRPSQKDFGERWGIGTQSAVGNFLTGKSALSMKAAQGFARGLNCEIAAFSPRLARAMASIARGVEPPLAGGVREQARAYQVDVAPTLTSIAGGRSRLALADALQTFGQIASQADKETRGEVAEMLSLYLRNPMSNAIQLDAVVNRLLGELDDASVPPQLQVSQK